jgi:hypothetical protein
MAVTTSQKQSMLQRAMALSRQLSDWNRQWNAFKEEYDAENYGGVIVTGDLTAYTPTNGLTATEFTDNIAAQESVSSAVETNKTNLYKFAAP